MAKDQEIANVAILNYQFLNVVLDKETQNEEVKYGSEDEDNDFENSDSMNNNNDNKPRYYRELISRKNEDRCSPMWNQFIPSHVENVKYLVSKIPNFEENTEDFDETPNAEIDNEVLQSVTSLPVNPSPPSSFSAYVDTIEDPTSIYLQSSEDKQINDIQMDYDWQDDLIEYELQWSINDLF